MKKEIILKELNYLLKEDFSMFYFCKRYWTVKQNKILFNKLKNKYPNILKSMRYLLEIYKNRQSIDNCLKLYFCDCGNEKALTSQFCSNRNCIFKNNSVKINAKITKLKRYGDENYNNQSKYKQTCIEKYGCSNPMKSNNIKNKVANTKLKRYGDAHYTNREKAEKSFLKKYGVKSYMNTKQFREDSKKYNQTVFGKDYFTQTNEFQEKRKDSCNKKYGVDSYSKTDEYKEKIKKSSLERYGVDSPLKSSVVRKKAAKTNLKKYGVESYSKTKEFKERYKDKELVVKMKKKEKDTRLKNGTLVSDLMKNNEYYNNWLNKTKETMNEKYGVDFYTQSKEYKDLYKNKEWVDKKIQKEYNTMKQNNSFNTSKPEDYCYELLKSKFNDTIRNYSTDSRYQFNCDFYIPSKDLFIECHFHWTHGGTPFNENNKEHLKELEKWRSKNTQFYKNAEEVWTKRDPLKLKTFIDNKLNYKIFYTEKEFIEWFKGL